MIYAFFLFSKYDSAPEGQEEICFLNSSLLAACSFIQGRCPGLYTLGKVLTHTPE